LTFPVFNGVLLGILMNSDYRLGFPFH